MAVDAIPADQAIFDIGPETVARYCQQIAGARTVFWNGPMGVFEREPFANGTLGIARCVADASAYTVVGGGDSLAAIDAAGVGGAHRPHLDRRWRVAGISGGASLAGNRRTPRRMSADGSTLVVRLSSATLNV